MKQDLIKLRDSILDMMGEMGQSKVKTSVKVDRRMSISDHAIDKLAEVSKQDGKSVFIINQYQGDIKINVITHFSNILNQLNNMIALTDRKDIYLSQIGIDREQLDPLARDLWARDVKLIDSVRAYKNALGESALEQAGGNHRVASNLTGMAKSWFAKLKKDLIEYDNIEDDEGG